MDAPSCKRKMTNNVDGLIKNARAAMDAIKHYSQAEIDRLVKGIGRLAYDHAEPLAQMAIDETGCGRYESKVIKNRRTTMAAWHYLKDKKSVGLVEDDPVSGIALIAKPAGVVACVVPTTNPIATVIVNSMQVLKGKNSAIFAPHPKAKKSSAYVAKMLNGEIIRLGGPENLIQSIVEPEIGITQELMGKADVVVATGGPGMVKAAYSSGKPSFGVGQGNVQVVVDDAYQDFEYIAKTVVANRAYDGGMACTGEQAIFVAKDRKDDLIDAFARHRAFYVGNPEKIDRLKKTLFDEAHHFNRDCLGKSPARIGEMAGVAVPDDTEVLLLACAGVGMQETLSKEILCPVIKLYAYQDFRQAVEDAAANLYLEGAGHSAVIYSHDPERIAYFAGKIPVCRVDVNLSSVAGSGSPYNVGMAPTMSIGCGFWGNNSISDNLTYAHLLNYTRVIRAIPDVKDPTPEEVWGE